MKQRIQMRCFHVEKNILNKYMEKSLLTLCAPSLLTSMEECYCG